MVACAQVGHNAVEAEFADTRIERSSRLGALRSQRTAAERQTLRLRPARDAESVHHGDQRDFGASQDVGDLSDRCAVGDVTQPDQFFDIGEPQPPRSALALLTEAGRSLDPDAVALLLAAAATLQRPATLGVGVAAELVEHTAARQGETLAHSLAQPRVALEPTPERR